MEECNKKVWNIFDLLGISIPCSATYFLEVVGRVSLKVVTKESLRGRKTLKIKPFRLFYFSKIGGVRPNCLILFDQFGMTIPCSTICFLEVGVGILLKVATRWSRRGKNILRKLKFLGCFYKAKIEECNQKHGNVLYQFDITLVLNVIDVSKYFLIIVKMVFWNK